MVFFFCFICFLPQGILCKSQIQFTKLFHLLYSRLLTLGNPWLPQFFFCFFWNLVAFIIVLIPYKKPSILLKAALLMYMEDINRFLNKIDLSVAMKMAVEDTLLYSHIWGLDLWRVSLHCPPAFPYKPQRLTNVIHNSPIKIRNKTVSLHWWDKKDLTAECSV